MDRYTKTVLDIRRQIEGRIWRGAASRPSIFGIRGRTIGRIHRVHTEGGSGYYRRGCGRRSEVLTRLVRGRAVVGTWETGALWGTQGNGDWSRWVSRSLWIGGEDGGQMGKNGIGCLGWLPGPVGAGRARESGIFHSSLSSTLAVQRVDRGGRRWGRVRWGLDKEV